MGLIAHVRRLDGQRLEKTKRRNFYFKGDIPAAAAAAASDIYFFNNNLERRAENRSGNKLQSLLFFLASLPAFCVCVLALGRLSLSGVSLHPLRRC
jgi:hypothetical protein